MRVRREHTVGCTPVFQSDYLFVQMPGMPLKLHQVCNGLFMQMASEEDISFTTVEYTHTPQQDVPGLWGTFTKTVNQHFDPQDSKSGTKFVRHNGVVREYIIVFDVKVWVDKSVQPAALRVDAESLKVLAETRPTEYPWPEEIPDTHKNGRQNAPRAPRRAQAAAPAPAAATQRSRRARIIHDDDSTSEEDDPPAPIPEGFVSYEWDNKPIEHFFLWTALGEEGRQRQPQWHRGVVTATLESGRADGYTHDARFDGARYARSTTLTAAAAAEGVLVLMRCVEEQNHASGSHLDKEPQADGCSSEDDTDISDSTSAASSPKVAQPTPLTQAQQGQTSDRPKRNQMANLFKCSKCSERGSGFLYCPSGSPDGVVPNLLCAKCAPSRGWVTISLADFVRSMGL
mmetsp:Transcript_29047/g.66744  ORF Transcript_29047/g.66744 Transcript_29047/m.66744 type:complete len:400 (-) Transcript_29047:178-1377(-)